MNIVVKLIRANEFHKTRFHTERGELMPLLAFFRIPKALIDRLTGRYKFIPWIVPEAVSFLQRRMNQNWKVFEFGSGWSTIWYARHCKKITSIEDNIAWYKVVEDRVLKSHIDNCELKLVNQEKFTDVISAFPDESFDLIVVDGSEENKDSRVKAILSSMDKIKKGGYLLLDDSDRPQYRSVPEILSGWKLHQFTGVKPVPCMAIETSIYQRPLDH